MASISGITSASLYTSSDYQSTAPKASTPTAQGSTPAAPAEDSISLSPAGLAALKDSSTTTEKPTHAQLVMEAHSGNPTAKAKLALEKKEEGLSSCS
jgi:hypothetical protein